MGVHTIWILLPTEYQVEVILLILKLLYYWHEFIHDAIYNIENLFALYSQDS